MLNYEVVLANGTIIDANARQHTDLVRALRGGSNNFGIVTRFDLRTFSQGSLWGGDVFYDIVTAPQLLRAFVDFGANPNYDEYAALYQWFSLRAGAFSVRQTQMYAKAVANPTVFEPFTAIQPRLSNTLRIDKLTYFSNVTQVSGLR